MQPVSPENGPALSGITRNVKESATKQSFFTKRSNTPWTDRPSGIAPFYD